MLGSDLAVACQQRGLAAAVFDLPQCDITNHKHLTEALGGQDIVVNCAAYTNVEKAESEYELAKKANADAVAALGELVKRAGIWVLHISTDFVFDGKNKKPYLETDKPNPVNAYGRSKLLGERFLADTGCSHCIVRVEWTYGTHGNNFIKKLVERAKTGQPLKVVDDQIGSPTATAEAAKALCQLILKRPKGLFHFASAGYVNRFEMARFIFNKLNMSVDLTSCKTGDYLCAAERPLNSRFDCSKIKVLLDEPIEPWQGPLEHFLRQL